jgi:hypothetical protein
MLLSLAASAQDQVKVQLKAEKITVQDGKEIRSSADKAAPGDVLELIAIYKNTQKAPAKQVFANISIVAGEEYVPGTTSPAGAMATIDGVNFAPIPLKRTVKNKEGKTVEVEVPASEYRALRWNLGDLKGEESRTVSARVKLRSR